MSLSTLISNAFGRRAGNRAAHVISRESAFPDVTEAPLDSRRLIRDRKYCQVISKHRELEFDEVSIECAWRALQHEMAYVPSGSVRLMHESVIDQGGGYRLSGCAGDPVTVESFYLDRACVTNADYARFVKAGGYTLPQFWPQDMLPWVLQLVDCTGNTGPKFWSDGEPPEDKLDHPVVGICWYEAHAYAQWSGKRLPTSTEWQRAGTWSQCHSGNGSEPRYPWGNAFEHSKANLWKNDFCETIPVDALVGGSTPNGVRQLIGNVWEWIDARYAPLGEGEVRVLLEDVMAEVRGGAFDTYFASQATCQFRTGQPILHRPANVGFRCCISTQDLQSPTDRAVAEDAE